ncbi:MAG: alpha/beta hydrolase [Candidatus Acidiferrales bacterium]
MAEVFHRNIVLRGAAGKLEALLWTSSLDDPPFAAVVCHPHPLFGGTMHNKVVYQAAKTLHRRGMAVLRFNFRGAGLSEGAHDQGRGEADDVRAALDYLASEFPSRPILLAGFSFGAWVGLRVGCEDSRVVDLVGLGIPVNDSDFSYLHECAKAKLFLIGARDSFASRDRVEKLFSQIPEPKKVYFVEGGDHFFKDHLAEMAGALDAWVVEQHPELNALAPESRG